MRLQLIRNATLRLTYAGHELLIDPDFAPKHSRPPLRGISPNPLVELPLPPEQIIAGVELVLVSHLHSDHFDPTAERLLLPRQLPIVCQPEDARRLRTEKKFLDVRPLSEPLEWEGITITRAPGQHGSGKVLEKMKTTSGFVLKAINEPTLYCAGDTILFEGVRETIQRHAPDIIVTNSGGAVWDKDVLIIMDAAQTVEVCRAAPSSRVVAVHLDSFDHGTVGRQDMRRFAAQAGIPATQLLIPDDGETLELH